MGALVELKGITRSFGGVRALKGIDFDLQPGEGPRAAGGERRRQVDADAGGWRARSRPTAAPS